MLAIGMTINFVSILNVYGLADKCFGATPTVPAECTDAALALWRSAAHIGTAVNYIAIGLLVAGLAMLVISKRKKS
jgi:LPXTG-motif cell wall-anchored protein